MSAWKRKIVLTGYKVADVYFGSASNYHIYKFLICFPELSVSETQGFKSTTTTTDLVAISLCSSSIAVRDYVCKFYVVIYSFLSYLLDLLFLLSAYRQDKILFIMIFCFQFYLV